MKILLFLLMLILMSGANAQTNLSDTLISDQLQSVDSLPEHSEDRYIGAYIAEVPKYQGSTEMKTEFILDIDQVWSNGFSTSINNFRPYDTYQLGKHFSTAQNMDYGLLTGVGLSRSSFIKGSTGNNNSDWMPFLGGFFKYRPAEDIQLNSEFLYFGGQFKGSVYANLNIIKNFSLADHQTVSISAGTVLGNHDFANTQFGISPGQSHNYGYPAYEASAGVEDVHGSVNWRWNLNSAWMLNSTIYASHLTSNVSGTKQVQNENNASLFVGLAYRF